MINFINKLDKICLVSISCFASIILNGCNNNSSNIDDFLDYYADCGCSCKTSYCREYVEFNPAIHKIPQWIKEYEPEIEEKLNQKDEPNHHYVCHIANPKLALSYEKFKEQASELNVTFDTINIETMYKRCVGFFHLRKGRKAEDIWPSGMLVKPDDTLSIGWGGTLDIKYETYTYIEIIWLPKNYVESYALDEEKTYNWESNISEYRIGIGCI